jgi:putative nucleotidyltransferase with HDIG domain
MSYVADIDALLEDVVTLPSLPDSVMRVTELLNDPDCAIPAVAEALAMDPALTLKTLRLANSAYYALRNEITSIEHCVNLLGLKVIKNVVFTASVFETIQGGEQSHLRHSVACAFAMRELAKNSLPASNPFEQPEEAFMYGLLHDVGKLIFKEHLEEQFNQVVETCKNKPIAWHDAEVEIIGVDHGAVGAALARNWKLSDRLCDAIAGHHNLDNVTDDANKPFAALLGIADGLCYEAGLPCHDAAQVKVDPAFWELAGTSPDACAQVIQAIQDSRDAIDELTRAAS